MQVSDQERAAQLESMIREVASMVSEKCVHPVSQRPYTMAQIRDAMKTAGFMVHPNRNVKQQFLDCVKLIQKKGVLDIERAKMQLAIVLGEEDGDGDCVEKRNHAIKMLVEEGVSRSDISPANSDNDTRIVFKSDPSLYRKVDGIARDALVQGRLEIIQQCVTEEGDVTLGSELERRAQQKQQHQKNEDEKEARNRASVDNEQTEAAVDVDDNIQTLSKKLESAAISDDDDQPYTTTKKAVNSRKAQKAQQKKSKKAKRREKEEQAEREQRIAAEKTRQQERAERLGIADNNNNAASGNGDGKAEGSAAGVGDTKPCNTCGGAFTPGEYRSHFRSDWHRYNVKLKMKSVAPVCEREFLLCDSDAFFD